MNDLTGKAFEQSWEYGSFDGLERQQLREWRDIPFEKKLEWLEEAHRIALSFQKQRQAKGIGTVYPDGRFEK